MIGGLKIAQIRIGQGVTIGRPISADLVAIDQGAVGPLASSLLDRCCPESHYSSIESCVISNAGIGRPGRFPLFYGSRAQSRSASPRIFCAPRTRGSIQNRKWCIEVAPYPLATFYGVGPPSPVDSHLFAQLRNATQEF